MFGKATEKEIINYFTNLITSNKMNFKIKGTKITKLDKIYLTTLLIIILTITFNI